jgi:hypothetical protein
MIEYLELGFKTSVILRVSIERFDCEDWGTLPTSTGDYHTLLFFSWSFVEVLIRGVFLLQMLGRTFSAANRVSQIRVETVRST